MYASGYGGEKGEQELLIGIITCLLPPPPTPLPPISLDKVMARPGIYPFFANKIDNNGCIGGVLREGLQCSFRPVQGRDKVVGGVKEMGS